MPRKELIRWSVEPRLSEAEEAICERCKRNGRLYAFLRRHRHELFDEAFEAELTSLYTDSPKGHPPLPPAMLAMVTVLQAADGVSDEGAVNEVILYLPPSACRPSPSQWTRLENRRVSVPALRQPSPTDQWS